MIMSHLSFSFSILFLVFHLCSWIIRTSATISSSSTTKSSISNSKYFSVNHGYTIPKYGWINTDDEKSTIVQGTNRCNIDRQPSITNENFLKYYLGKKPVILGSSTYNLNFTIDDLQLYINKIGNLPYALFTPVGKPSVGGKIIRFAEYLSTFTTQSERDEVKQASSLTSAATSVQDSTHPLVLSFGSTIAAGFHCNPLSSSMHKELLTDLLQHRQRLLSPKGKSTPNSSWNTSYMAHPVLCMAHGNSKQQEAIYSTTASSLSDTDILSPYCTCPATFLVVGESGSGLPWHFHGQVPGNELLIGKKRWFISRHSPIGGFNHRRSHYEWVRDIYPTLDPSVFEIVPPQIEPAIYECTLVPGEVMYVPDSWYHATLDIGHAISVVYDHCDNDVTMARQNKIMQSIAQLHTASEPLLWIPFKLQSAKDTIVSNPLHQYYTIQYPSFRNGAKLWIEKLRELHTHNIQDPYLDSTLGSIGSKISDDLYIVLSGAGKANHAVQLSAPLDGISMNLQSLTPTVDFDELKIAEFACALWPTEPEFLLATGRSYLRLARDWIKEYALPSRNNNLNNAYSLSYSQAVASLDSITLLPQNFPIQMMEQSIPRLFYTIKINPYYPDAFALLSYSIDTRVGIEGWIVNRTMKKSDDANNKRDSYEERMKTKRKQQQDTKAIHTNSNLPQVEYYQYNENSYYLLDIALAASRRSLQLDPFSIALCNHISILLSKGAIDRFTFTTAGDLQFYSFIHSVVNISIPEETFLSVDISEDENTVDSENPVFPPDGSTPASLTAIAKFTQYYTSYTKRWMKFRGTTSIISNLLRLDRVYNQILQCMDIGIKSIPISSSKDTKKAIEKDFEETLQLLRIVQNQRDNEEKKYKGLSNLWYVHPYKTELQRNIVWNEWIVKNENYNINDKQLLSLYLPNMEYSTLINEPVLQKEDINMYSNYQNNNEPIIESFQDIYQYISQQYRGYHKL